MVRVSCPEYTTTTFLRNYPLCVLFRCCGALPELQLVPPRRIQAQLWMRSPTDGADLSVRRQEEALLERIPGVAIPNLQSRPLAVASNIQTLIWMCLPPHGRPITTVREAHHVDVPRIQQSMSLCRPSARPVCAATSQTPNAPSHGHCSTTRNTQRPYSMTSLLPPSRMEVIRRD